MHDLLHALEKSFDMAKHYLIVQTVTDSSKDAGYYFVTGESYPGTHWQHGCRFNHAWLEKEIRKRGYYVVDSEPNVLPGNSRPEDCDSSYFLIDTQKSKPHEDSRRHASSDTDSQV